MLLNLTLVLIRRPDSDAELCMFDQEPNLILIKADPNYLYRRAELTQTALTLFFLFLFFSFFFFTHKDGNLSFISFADILSCFPVGMKTLENDQLSHYSPAR